MIGNYIGLITNDCYLLICYATPPFAQKEKIRLSSMISPSTSPLAHLTFNEQKTVENPYFKNIILSAFLENNIKFSIDEDEHLDIISFQFPRDFIILSSTYTKDPNIFAFLISDFHQKHYIMLYDTYLMCEIEKEEVANDSFLISTCSDIENNLFDIFILSYHSICKYKGEKIDTESRILKCFPLMNGEFLIQTEQGFIFGFDPKKNKLFKKGKLPLISLFYSIQNDFLLCIPESEDSFIIPFSSRYPVSEPSVEFQFLPRTNLYLNPLMTTAIFRYSTDNKNANLIAASDSKITSYSCTIPFSITKMEDLTLIFNDQITYIDNSVNQKNLVNDKIKIFAIKDINSNKGEIIDFIATTKKYSTSFFGKVPISVNPTIDIKTFCDESIIQIHKKGIKSLNTDFEWSSNEKEVISGSIGDEHIVVIMNDSSVLLFDRNFQQLPSALETVEGKITSVTFCNTFIAVATDIPEKISNDGRKGAITIYSIEFDRVHSQVFLLSSVVSLVFVSETQHLFASTSNGHVLSWQFDELGYIDTSFCSTIFINANSPSSLTSIGLDILIANDDGLCMYDSRKISPIQVGKLLSLCAVDDTSFFALMSGSLEIHRVSIAREDLCLLKNFELSVAKTPRRVVSSGNLIVSLIRSTNKNDSGSFIDFFSQTALTQFNIGIGQSEANEGEKCHFTPVSMVEVPAKKVFVVGLVKKEELQGGEAQKGCLFVVSADEEHQTASIVKTIDLGGIPYCIKPLNEREVLVGAGKNVHVLSTRDWSLFEKPVAVVPTQAAFIDFECEDTELTKFVWIADRTQSVFCFQPVVNEVSQHTLLELAAIDSEQRQVTAVAPLGEFMAAVGDKFGGVTVLRLPSGLIVGAPSWGEWKPPERGATVPAGRCLEKVATFSVGQAVTSILINRRKSGVFGGLVFFYTTLFGQIGAVVQVANDEEFAILNNAARVAEKICNEELGFVHVKRYQGEKRAVVSTKYFDFIDQVGQGIQRKIEEALNFPFQQIRSLLCRYKAMATF